MAGAGRARRVSSSGMSPCDEIDTLLHVRIRRLSKAGASGACSSRRWRGSRPAVLSPSSPAASAVRCARRRRSCRTANEALQAEIAERERVEVALAHGRGKISRHLRKRRRRHLPDHARTGSYLVANPTLARMYGYDSVADLQASLTDIGARPLRRSAAARRVSATHRAGWHVHRFESQIHRKDGSVIWISEHARAAYDAAGNVALLRGHGARTSPSASGHEAELEKLHKQLVETSRQAGMAEVATGVLHNVGNVLNSVNVSAMLIADRLSKSRVAHLAQGRGAAAGARGGSRRVSSPSDPKGKKLPAFIASLAERLGAEQAELLRETRRAREEHRAHQGDRRHAAELREGLRRHRSRCRPPIWSRTRCE